MRGCGDGAGQEEVCAAECVPQPRREELHTNINIKMKHTKNTPGFTNTRHISPYARAPAAA